MSVLFKIDVVLLSFANLDGTVGEKAQGFVPATNARGRDEFVCQKEHGIARKDGSVVVPFLMHRFTTAAHIGTIHHIIVHEGVIVIHLDADSCRERTKIVFTIKAIGGEQEHGAQAFSPTSENVANGFVESLWTFGIVEGFNRRFDVFQHGHSGEVLATHACDG